MKSGGITHHPSNDGTAFSDVGTEIENLRSANALTAVSSDAALGTDNVLIKSDGTGRKAQATGIVCDDSNNVSGVAALAATSLDLGNADTTLARAAAGDVNVEGNRIYRAGGTDVPVADGGTAASDAATARTNLGVPYASAANMEAAAASVVVTPDILHRHPGFPKAQARFDSSANILGTSFGVSGVVRTSTGVFTVTLSTAMSDTNFGVDATINADVAGGSAIDAVPASTTTFVIRMRDQSNNLANYSCHFSVFGDQ